MTSRLVDDTNRSTDIATSAMYRHFLVEHGPAFRSPVHLKGAFTGVSRLSRLLLEALGTVARAADGDVRLRAFNGFALDYQLTNKLATTAPDQQPDAAAWLHDLGGETACVAINQLSRWNVELSQWFIDRIRELIGLGRHLGVETLDTYTFISAGKGWTPFGIHNDYEPSFIFHLGPGPKTAWVWPAGEPAGAVLTSSPALNGVSFSISEHLATAQRYVMQPGDFLCIPAGLYHIFQNTEPSAFLGITVFPTSAERVFAGVLGDGDRSAPSDSAPSDITDVRDSVATLTRRLETELADFSTRLAHRLNRLRSCGYTYSPHPAALAALSQPKLAERTFSTRFPGVFAPAGADDQVFVFGRPLRTGLPNDNEQVCAVLNTLQMSTATEAAARLKVSPDDLSALLTRSALLGGLTYD